MINKFKNTKKGVKKTSHTCHILPRATSSSTVTYILHRTQQQRTSMEEKGEGKKKQRKRDEGREGVSEAGGLKVENLGGN